MKIDRSRLKKCTSEVPAECQALISKLRSCSHAELLEELKQIDAWTFGKCELFHWIDVLDLSDSILEEAVARSPDNPWELACDLPQNREAKELLLWVLHFTTLLIEHSFSRHLYNSMEHLVALLSSCNMNVVLGVLNLLYMFSKRSNFITRLNSDKRQALLSRLIHLAESWGGKENCFGLADCCEEFPKKPFPASATTLHFEFYAENPTVAEPSATGTSLSSTKKVGQMNLVTYIHIENVDKLGKTPAQIMNDLLKVYNVPQERQMALLTHIRLARSFSDYRRRLQCVQARLQALSVLVYSNALQENAHSLLHPRLLEELVELLALPHIHRVEIHAAALRTLTSIIHLDRNPHFPKKPGLRLNMIIGVLGASEEYGCLPRLVRTCITTLTSPQPDGQPFPFPLATALFSFLYHLASYQAGGEALVSCDMMESLFKVINWPGSELEHITFVTRAVRVIDLITNIDMQGFQTHSGLTSFINRLDMEVNVCRKEQPFEIEPLLYQDAPQTSRERSVEREEASSTSRREHETFDERAESSLANFIELYRFDMEFNVFMKEPSCENCEIEPLLLYQDAPQTSRERSVEREEASSTSRREHETFDEREESSNPIEISEDENTVAKADEKNEQQPDYSAAKTGKTCLPQRAALLKSMLNFLKKAIQDPAFSDSIRHVMEGTLPSSLKHIISNSEYYGPSLFLFATDVVTVYVFQEPSLLSSLQDNGLTDVVLHALLIKEVPATREVLGSLPNVFSALCLNQRGLESFVKRRPFERLFKVLLSPVYLSAMRRRRSDDPLGDTVSNLGNAMDEPMRHQPSLKVDAIAAIIKLLKELCVLGCDPRYICWRAASKSENLPSNTASGNRQTSGQSVGVGVGDSGSAGGGGGGSSSDEEEEDEEEASTSSHPQREEQPSILPPQPGPPPQPREKTPIALVEYIHNVMKFVDAILSINSNGDHCREFVVQEGLVPLLSFLGLPSLPVDHPVNQAAQSVASSVCKILKENMTLFNSPSYPDSCNRHPYVGRVFAEEDNLDNIDLIYQFIKKISVANDHRNASIFYTAPHLIGPPKWSIYKKKFDSSYIDALNEAQLVDEDVDMSTSSWHKRESQDELRFLCWTFGTQVHKYIDIEFHESVYPIRVYIGIYEYDYVDLIEISAQDPNNQWIKLGVRPFGTHPVFMKSRLFSPVLSSCDFKTNVLRLGFSKRSPTIGYTILNSVMLIGTSELIHPTNSIESFTNLLRKVNMHEDDNLDGLSLSRCSLFALPDEILIKIFKNLDLKTLCGMNKVAKRFNNLMQSSDLYTRLNFQRVSRECTMRKVFCYFGSRCNSLQQLDLTASRFSVNNFIDFLGECGTRLTHLRLSCCTSIENVAVQKISAICRNLKELDLNWCVSIEDEGLSCLDKLNSLEHLSLCNTHITTERLCKILQKNQRLRELNIDLFNHCNPYFIKFFDIAVHLKDFCLEFQSINIQNSWNVTHKDINVLAECKNLRKVNFPISTSVTEGSLTRLLSSQRLELVYLHSIVLTNDILNLLSQCKNLKQLYFCNVKFNDPEKYRIIFQECGKLQEFHLTFCKISEAVINKWREIHPHVSVYTYDDILATRSLIR